MDQRCFSYIISMSLSSVSVKYVRVVYKLVELGLPNLAIYLSSLDGKPLQLILASSS